MQKHLVFVTISLKFQDQMKAKQLGIQLSICFIVCGLGLMYRTGNTTDVGKIYLHRTEERKKKAATFKLHMIIVSEIELTLRDDRLQFGHILIELFLSNDRGRQMTKMCM